MAQYALPIRRARQTKIVATVGPATASDDGLRALLFAGVDVFRLNFSHGHQETHGEVLARIRRIEAEVDRPIGVMADLQGPKLRIGTFRDGAIALTPGRRFRLDLDPAPGDETRVFLPHPDIMAALTPGSDVLLDDGKVRLRVVEGGPDHLDTEILAGTRLSNHKGFNVPSVILPLSPLTDKDRRDLAFALDQGVEWIALSFVQRPEDVIEARELIGDRAAIILKLEKPSAITHLTELVALSDAIMVARGDLGVELPGEEVPILQKIIVRACRKAGKPVIIATQMLESMTQAPAPTRAEISDVANAIYDGADAVMLSAETAAGAYPIEAVAVMDRIARRVERDATYREITDAQHPEPEHTDADAITASAHQTARTISSAAIVTFTTSGSTTLRAARERPAVPILGLTTDRSTARRLALSYGVHCVHLDEDIHSFSEMVQRADRIAAEHGLAADGERIVVTAGVPFGRSGTTNVLRIIRVGDADAMDK